VARGFRGRLLLQVRVEVHRDAKFAVTEQHSDRSVGRFEPVIERVVRNLCAKRHCDFR
jgi:hypothetical protein